MIKRIVLCAALLAASLANAQTTIVANHIAQDPTGTLLGVGQLCVTPVVNGRPGGFQAAGTTQVLPRQVCVPVTAGSIGSALTVADTATAAPSGVGYQVQIQDYRGIPIYSFPQLIFPTGSTWSLDSWVPTTTTPVTAVGISVSNSAPTGDCGLLPRLWYVPNASSGATSVTIYGCVLRAWVISVGSGGGGGTFTGGTLTSALYLFEDPIVNTEAANKHYTDAQTAAAQAAAQASSLQKSANLSDVASPATARSNIGLATAHQIQSLMVCSDVSASGTAQSCSTAVTFTPAANDCVIYATSTANTGTGLTLNVNSAGAKSVAKWLGSTTLAAGDVAANSPQLACYTGTVWNLSTIGNVPSGGGASGFPWTLGSTTITSGGTFTSVAGLTVDGVSPAEFGFLDATSSIQTQLNAKDASGAAASAQAAGLQKSSNLSDLANAGTARTNLGLGTSATQAAPTGHSTAGILTCADTSASGTAQTCSTSPTFTPVANDCVIYTTTTANSGTGLTLNVNSLGAKSVAKWLNSTTLAAGDVETNSPQLACYTGTVWNLSTIGNAPSGGGSFTDPGVALGDLYYRGASAMTILSGPTVGTVPYSLCSTPSGGAATAPAWCLAGIGGRTVSGTTDTIAATDRGTSVTYSNASGVAVTLTSAATLGNNFDFVTSNQGAGAVTFTPGAGTINGGATLVLSQGDSCAINSQDNTNYVARCTPGLLAAGSNITFTPSASGKTVSSSSGTGGLTNTTITIGTSVITANSCSTVSTFSMIGLATTSTISVTPGADVSSTTGWSPATSGQLFFTVWPSAANTGSYKVCNPTSASITPGASTTWNVSGVTSGATGLNPTTITVSTSAIAANTCATAATATITGLATSSTIAIVPASDVSSTTGWSPGSSGALYFTAWPSSNTVNYRVCNPTSASITPGASTTWNVSGK